MQMPEELYQRLAAAVEQTLLTSESIQDAMSNISAAGFHIRLDVWAESTPTLFDILSDEDGQLDLFGSETSAGEQVEFNWLTTDEDIDLLRCMGIRLDA